MLFFIIYYSLFKRIINYKSMNKYFTILFFLNLLKVFPFRIDLNRKMINRIAAFNTILVICNSPVDAVEDSIYNGQIVFSNNCAACHDGGNNVILSEKTLKKEALLEYLIGGFSENSIADQVTIGKNAMPAFGGRLSDEEIRDVASYVYYTANNDLW